MQLDVLLPAVAGVLATLLGVGLGGVLTRRQQVDAWSRDRQVDACAEIVRASAQVQRALRDLYLARIAQMDLDWRPWTEALAVVDLVGHPDVVDAAHAMDEAIWRSAYAARDKSGAGEEVWETINGPMEAARLIFINTSRKHLLTNKQPLTSINRRPALAELTSNPPQPSLGSDHRSSPRHVRNRPRRAFIDGQSRAQQHMHPTASGRVERPEIVTQLVTTAAVSARLSATTSDLHNARTSTKLTKSGRLR
jgi:hypothetical protein